MTLQIETALRWLYEACQSSQSLCASDAERDSKSIEEAIRADERAKVGARIAAQQLATPVSIVFARQDIATHIQGGAVGEYLSNIFAKYDELIRAEAREQIAIALDFEWSGVESAAKFVGNLSNEDLARR